MFDFHFYLNLGLAVGLGAIIGLERQWRQRMAGLRTNALVSAGAALFALLSQEISGGDSQRIAAQVVSGIGFLGAGVIMRDGLSIRGLNTAATIWCSAAVGSLAGFGCGSKATIAALVILATNLFLRPIANKINAQPDSTEQEFKYQIRVVCHDSDESHIRALMLNAVNTDGLVLRSIHSEDLNGSQKVEVDAQIECPTKNHPLIEKVVNRLSLEKGVSAASWQLAPNEVSA